MPNDLDNLDGMIDAIAHRLFGKLAAGTNQGLTRESSPRRPDLPFGRKDIPSLVPHAKLYVEGRELTHGSDWLQNTASWSSLEEIASLPLENVGSVAAPQAAALKAALDLVAIRDIAFWPPHGVARALVSEAAGTVDHDQLQTEARDSRFEEFPTERLCYGTLVMLQMQFDGERAPLNKTISLKGAFSQSTDSLGQRSAHTRRSPSRGPRRTSPSTTCCRRLSFHEAIR